jgi:hypothetical protein
MTADLMDICVRLARKPLVGARYSVGAYTPAAPDPDGCTWAVLDLRGSPCVLCHDSYEAAVWWVRLEEYEGDYLEGLDLPLRDDSDRVRSLRELADRWHYDYQHMGWPMPACLAEIGMRP